jgi:PadR family transcriptional regulator PadR
MGKEGGVLIQGTLDMLVLKALQLEPMHGWGITERIQEWSANVLSVNQGSLYPSLYRLQRQGWITSEWAVTENGRRARYYQITRAGRKRLSVEQQSWERLSQAVNLILQMSTP